MSIPAGIEIFKVEDPVGWGAPSYQGECVICDRQTVVCNDIEGALYFSLVHLAEEHFPNTWRMTARETPLWWAHCYAKELLAAGDQCLMKVNGR